MPQTPIVYDDAEVLDADGSGFTVRIGNTRAFVGKYVPADGTTIHRAGDRGRLVLPRWYAEQQGLPLTRRMSDAEVDRWFSELQLRVASMTENAEHAPGDAEAQAALARAEAELAAALALRARRPGQPR